MGQSIDTRVTITDIDLRRNEVTYRQHPQYPDDTVTSELRPKAAKALRGAEVGDEIVIVLDYDAILYPIIKARRITGTLEGRIEAIEAALKLMGGTL